MTILFSNSAVTWIFLSIRNLQEFDTLCGNLPISRDTYQPEYWHCGAASLWKITLDLECSSRHCLYYSANICSISISECTFESTEGVMCVVVVSKTQVSDALWMSWSLCFVDFNWDSFLCDFCFLFLFWTNLLTFPFNLFLLHFPLLRLLLNCIGLMATWKYLC